MPNADSTDTAWLQRAQALVDYHEEATAFLRRAGEYFPVSPEDVEAVCALWVEADHLDESLYGALEAMSQELLAGSGVIDVTRGADTIPVPGGDESLVYQCTWSLDWPDDRRVAVVLSIEPGSRAFSASVQSSGGGSSPLGVPIQADALQQALSLAYYRASTPVGPP